MESRHPIVPIHDLSQEWRRWIAENKMLGIDDESLIEVLKQNGIEEQNAVKELAAIARHPYFEAGHWLAQKLRKIESLLDVYADLALLNSSSRFRTIERRNNLPRDEFLEKYYSTNRPVVLLDLMKNWNARTVWNPSYFKAFCGNETVEVMAGRDSDERYEVNSESHKTTMLFGDYIDRITKAGKGNDYYLVANNNLLQREGMKQLLDDIEIFPEYLDESHADGGVFFWFGPAGTITPLHHDAMNIFMSQVVGRKRVTLIPSCQIHRLYNDMGVYSEVNFEDPNYSEYPEFREAQVRSLVLKPGEVLFIPVGWWHHVHSLDLSVTVSFTNFLFPNHYEWRQPHIQRREAW